MRTINVPHGIILECQQIKGRTLSQAYAPLLWYNLIECGNSVTEIETARSVQYFSWLIKVNGKENQRF